VRVAGSDSILELIVRVAGLVGWVPNVGELEWWVRLDGQVLYVATQQCGEPGEEDA